MKIPNRVTDITGQKFGRWTVEEYVGQNKHNGSLWRCVCECGKTKIVNGSALRKGSSKSCGCLQREAASRTIKKAIKEGKCKPKNGHPPAYKHGGVGTKLHKKWQRMRRRCRDIGYDGQCKYCDIIKQMTDDGDGGYGDALYLPGDWFCAAGERKDSDG